MISRVRSYGNFLLYLEGKSEYKVECVYMGEDCLAFMRMFRKELR